MSTAPRNGFKGYTYQQYIFTLLLAKMDTEREIVKIIAEAPATKQFDDLYVEMIDGSKYRIQVKNNPDTILDDIEVNGNNLKIKTSNNKFNPDDNNILIVKTSKIATDKQFWNINSTEKNGIIIIPLQEENVQDLMDNLYRSEKRETEIIHLAYTITTQAKFEVLQKDLPTLERMSLHEREYHYSARCNKRYSTGNSVHCWQTRSWEEPLCK